MLNFFIKRKLSRQLSDCPHREAVQDLLDGRALETPKIQSGRIDFIFAFARADTPEQLAERVGLVANAGIEHEAVVHDLIGPLVVMAFGTLRATQFSSSRQQLVTHL